MIPIIPMNKEKNIEKFITAFHQKKKHLISNDTFFETIKDLDINFYPYYYLKAYYLYKQDINITEAIGAISKAIDTLNQSSKFNSINPFHGYFYDIEVSCPIQKVYGLAGEIYAKAKDNAKALECFIKFQYYSCQLKTEFQKANDGNSAFVYSFRTLNKYVLSDLINHEITVVHPSKMNDPFDTFALLWSKEEHLEETCTNTYHIEPFSKSFQYYKLRSFVGNQELTQTSNVVKNILMWSHYGNSHAGFCIEYKLSNEFIKTPRSDSYKHHYLKRVEYGKTLKLTSKTINTTEGYASKSKEWEYEQEVRLISYDPTCEKDNLQIPLDPNSSIHAIYFGYRCSGSDKKTIIKLLGNNIKYYNVKSNPEDIHNLIIEKYKSVETDTTK